MTTSARLPDVDPPGTAARSTGDRRWDRARYGLVAGWLLFLLVMPLAAERTGDWNDVRHLVQACEVTQVTVAGELPPTASGSATVDVHWRHGPLRYVTTVRQVRGDSDESQSAANGVNDILHSAPSERLVQLQPGVRVARHADPSYGDHSIIGFRLPSALAVVALLLSVAGLAVLVLGPRPWRATPWAWFWLLWNPVGMAAFLLLSGPFPGLPAPRDVDRRLTGGWSFLLASLLAAGTH